MSTKKKKRTRVSVPEDFADFGAIFMANRATMEECLDWRLFGLPSSQAGFVRGVRAGMVLFLFEYEKRELYGVFQASSNGGMNIIPSAYSSSGKRFPAQVRFSKIWVCEPLCEDEFRDAIRENYYDRNKFLFGLSQDQVTRLLWLFNSKRTEVATFRSLSCERERVRKYSSGTGSGGTETNRLTLRRKLSSGGFFATCKQPESCPSDQTVKDEARGSRSWGESGISTSSFECESGPDDFGSGGGATIFEEEPENLKDSLKDIGADLEDFIPLPSPDNSNSEMEFSGNDQTESTDFEQYFPIKLVNCGYLGNERNQNSLQVNNDHISNISDCNKEHLRIKRLYSDNEGNRSSVFSRLKYGPKDIGQENRESTKEDKLVQKTRGDLLQGHGYKEITAFSRLSLASQVMQDINDRAKLQIGSGKHKKTMEETDFAPGDREDDSEMQLLAAECMGQKKEEKIKGCDSVQDIMDTLLWRHRTWRKIDDGHKAFAKEGDKLSVKKNVFSRLSWVSESLQQDNVVLLRFQKGNGNDIKRVRGARFCLQERNGSYRGNKAMEEQSATLYFTREDKVPNQNYESEQNFEKSAHISKLPKRQTQTEERDCANGSESKCKPEPQPRRKLVGPLFNKSSEVKTITFRSCLNVHSISEESSAYKENSGSGEASPKGRIVEDKMTSLEKEAQTILDPSRCKADKGEANCNFASKESNSGELLADRFNTDSHTMTAPLKTYKRRAKKIHVNSISAV